MKIRDFKKWRSTLLVSKLRLESVQYLTIVIKENFINLFYFQLLYALNIVLILDPVKNTSRFF